MSTDPTLSLRDQELRRMLVATSSAEPPPAHRRTMSTIGLAAALVAAALVATTFAMPKGSATAEASEILHKAALAADATDPVVGVDQFLLIATTSTSTGFYSNDAAMQTTERRRLYVPGAPTATWFLTTEASEPNQVFGDRDVEVTPQFQHAGGGEVKAYRGAEGAFGGMFAFPTVDEFAAMPRDPDALLRHLYEVSTGSGSKDEAAFRTAYDALITGLMPADLRSAMFEAVAKIPGVYLEDGAADLGGQRGVAISRRDSAQSVAQLIIEPSTGRFIGVRDVLTAGQGVLPTGTVTSSSAIRTSVVDEVPTLTYIAPGPAG